MTEEYNSEHSTASVETQLVGSESRMITRSNNANKPLKQCAAFLSQYIKEHTLEDNEELIQAVSAAWRRLLPSVQQSLNL